MINICYLLAKYMNLVYGSTIYMYTSTRTIQVQCTCTQVHVVYKHISVYKYGTNYIIYM